MVSANLLHHRQLIWQITKREVLGRYRGSFFGLFWSFLSPLLLLTVYTFVFGVVFRTRWGAQTGGTFEFALTLYTGLIVFNFFAECVNRAPSIILGNVNLVKKVVFPLEILPLGVLGAALFHTGMSMVVLILFHFIVHGSVSWTIVFMPIILVPLLLMVSGVVWFLAATGVFVRDIAQVVGMFTMVIMFISPLFYPLSAVPERFRHYLYLNPLTFVIEQMRMAVISGAPPDWLELGLYTVASSVVAWLGYVWFQRTRKGFADVL
jgi:lipopolysaccharide transport system permease protein